MTKEFIPYEQALELKELGFDEECWCYFINDIFNDSMFLKKYEYFEHMNKNMEYTLSPLYSQVFRWFREKHNKYCFIELVDNMKFDYVLYEDIQPDECVDFGDGPFNTYEEAELECLKKLIEIVKNK